MFVSRIAFLLEIIFLKSKFYFDEIGALLILWSSGVLNIRGSDIPYNPLVFSYLFISSTEVVLFIDKEKLEPINDANASGISPAQHLVHVRILPYDQVTEVCKVQNFFINYMPDL